MKDVQGRRRYIKPALRHLGSMAMVTRKTFIKGDRGRDLGTFEKTKQ